ncbi:MAG TPA: hypothetical protein PKH07_04945 [bacterium]|nr:hypothetical protein [bacterium]
MKRVCSTLILGWLILAAQIGVCGDQVGMDNLATVDRPQTVTLLPGETMTFGKVTLRFISEGKVPGTGQPGLQNDMVGMPLAPGMGMEMGMPMDMMHGVPQVTYHLILETSGPAPLKLQLTSQANLAAYYGEVVVARLGLAGNQMRANLGIQNTEIPVTNAPFKKIVYFSAYCPVQIGSWELQFSPEQHTFSDGTQCYQLFAYDRVSKTTMNIPVVEKTERQMGRFSLFMGESWNDSKTVVYEIRAEADYARCGGETYVDSLQLIGGTAESSLQDMADEYGITIEWVESDSYPGLLEYCRALPFSSVRSQGLLRELLDTYLGYSLVFEWKDPYHLRVSGNPQHFQIMRSKEEGARNLDEITAIFEKDYQTVTKIIPVTKMGAEALRAFIEPQLSSYALVDGNSPQKNVLLQKAPYRIVASTGEFRTHTLRLSEERCISDPKTDSLLIQARPSTIARIEQALEDVYRLIDEGKKQSEPVSRFQVEIILLQAASSDNKSSKSSDLASFGLTEDDLKPFGLDGVSKLGRGMVTLIGERSELGQARVALTDLYSCALQFQDFRKPYVVVKGSLMDQNSNSIVLENTLYLEPLKPIVLGITNLKEALILVLRLK